MSGSPTRLDHPSASSARDGGLRYVTDEGPGLTRVRAGRGFVYRGPEGARVRDRRTLDRIRALAIPPAWERVWIAPAANAHIQATGRDARGRKQYRYHPRWAEVRDEAKYERILDFARTLPAIRRRLAADLRRPPLSRERVLATVVTLLERTLIRVGNEEYARANGSFGLTTLRDRHVQVRGTCVTFRFRAKSGVLQRVELDDAGLARSVQRCQDLPGQTLFQYRDADGVQRALDSADVNAYLRECGGDAFTAKDFRTWAGTLLAACALGEELERTTPTAQRRFVSQAIGQVAERLGNTKAVCRKCYVHPGVIEAFLDGQTLGRVAPLPGARPAADRGLLPAERAVVKLLEARTRRARRAAA